MNIADEMIPSAASKPVLPKRDLKRYPVVLAIAGSDSGGGAGIQADIKTISATGAYAASAITAVTVQNTAGVSAIHTVPADIVAGQIDAVLSDIGADAVKIGMLSTAEVVRTVASALKRNAVEKVILDPVMVATSGDRLLDSEAVGVLIEELLPLALIVTPNIPEAEILSGETITCAGDLQRVARKISGGKISVLIKAGHLKDEHSTDYFYNCGEDRMIELPSRRIDTVNTHGTGCTLSSALASYVAQGMAPDDAARLAKAYISGALLSASHYSIGHGHGPVDHFWNHR